MKGKTEVQLGKIGIAKGQGGTEVQCAMLSTGKVGPDRDRLSGEVAPSPYGPPNAAQLELLMGFQPAASGHAECWSECANYTTNVGKIA